MQTWQLLPPMTSDNFNNPNSNGHSTDIPRGISLWTAWFAFQKSRHVDDDNGGSWHKDGENIPKIMTGRRLRVRIRSEPPPGSAGEENWTLFARLAPQTVREFTGDTSVEFLPFCLTGDDLDENVYVSYNGGSIQEKGESLAVVLLWILFFCPWWMQFM